ncbi:basic amino acid/polyamine antiporter [Lactococcus cremoris]|uniref:Arginine/ornithine antiporter ArcD2 n=1 Tax=Lactococcus lactis subsp. cremoris (strain MG1363) TaxID=416870 RepID=ARCD2_LACLM|nr:basic amino acid/polyamine antiporter [Lactococcus cremoris]A2RNI1.1 RecName: Full=Arginine/ornithine antiporter ArcD2; AltName: Full=Arginine/ornithine exchanger [Lactococcus cremoris subsp. cremoris MG1363]ADJ61274.1 arginine/ornithine antiporter [Lactococcus cremoris subsp. cremoris NZ9000]KZK49347.1 Arginine/ornithine antiporter ArcD [Lactococcus cremoris]MCT4435457.1 amino acid permease [Lactococcus cremoris]MCT4446070.1 amino acid permease [Lactococcus cremoris]MCZ7688209.1 basic ami
MENKKTKGISLFALLAIIISGAIGGGVFNLANDLARGSTPGGVVISWLFIGFGILMLVLSFNRLITIKPDLSGVSDYARAGFGDFVGFLSGWGYWISAWTGTIGFAVLMMTSADYFFPSKFANSNGSLTILSVIIVSIISWILMLLVDRGVETAAAVNAIVMIAKLIPLVVFSITGIILFKANVFTQHFWQTFTTNFAADGSVKDFVWHAMTVSGLLSQIKGSLMVMVWVFVGIEGATMMGNRAKKKSDTAKATVIGLAVLLVIYVLLSLLPYGYMDQASLANVKAPGLVYILNEMVGGWGGSLMAVGLMISLLGAWLSWTMLPVEATQQLAEQKLLPSWFGKLNKYHAPSNSLLITQLMIQIFIIITYFVANAYNVFIYMATAVIMICYALVGAYLFKIGLKEASVKNILIGFFTFAFQALALYLSGWQYVWLAMILYTIGFLLFIGAKKESHQSISVKEWLGMLVVTVLGVLAIVVLICGAKAGTAFDLRGLLGF